MRDLLELAVDRLQADAGYLYAQNEDDRLGYALATVLNRTELSENDATGWLDRLRPAIGSGEPGPAPAWAANTQRTLAALYHFAQRGFRWYEPETGKLGTTVTLPHADLVQARVADVLRLALRDLD